MTHRQCPAASRPRSRLPPAGQEVRVTVRGGYSPDRIRARAGVPVPLVFDSGVGDCDAWIVFRMVGGAGYGCPDCGF